MKLTTRCGSVAVDGLNEALLGKAAEAKLLRTRSPRKPAARRRDHPGRGDLAGEPA
jgi:hypothetical protein